MEPNLKVTVAQLHPADRDGYLTKQGGSIKTWKKRWFVLKGKKLYYFKNKTDPEATGVIELEADSFVKDEVDKDKKRRFMFSVGTARRVFFMHADAEQDMRQWMQLIQRNINPPANSGNGNVGAPKQDPIGGGDKLVNGGGNKGLPQGNTPRARIANAKQVIPYLQEEQSKVLEFWQIWSESIPQTADLQPGMAIEFHVATSADMQKLTWRTAGPQNIFIQKMVDFFWNVGAPESEIDRLNDVGALINPVKIGSWIDMSAKGGMDGGWYFPVEIPLKLAVEAADAGDPTRKLTEWAETHGVVTGYSVGRDMGAAPPRQTEIRLRLPGSDFATQLRLALDAFFVFGFPNIPDDALAIIRRAGSSDPAGGLCLSVITSSEGFVRCGLLIPKPTPETIRSLCDGASGSFDDIQRFENSLGVSGPVFAEYQYLMKGFGYGVYKEGFDIVFHYSVGEDHGE
eukprot:TRINITY_DN2773_c0_g1_i1.p1 TRINITY_DN2773_c0_g1~~TRINITY_DN2773_c0_g1_i1.p1  ORF type:complete len:456 (-),score=103.37 TRINITY_DN2773_c0_g1_i1:396-1763(-)